MKNYVLLPLILKEEIIKILNLIIMKNFYRYQDREKTISSYSKIAIQSFIDYIAIFYYISNLILLYKKEIC